MSIAKANLYTIVSLKKVGINVSFLDFTVAQKTHLTIAKPQLSKVHQENHT